VAGFFFFEGKPPDSPAFFFPSGGQRAACLFWFGLPSFMPDQPPAVSFKVTAVPNLFLSALSSL